MEAKSLIVLLALFLGFLTPGHTIPIFRSPCQCPQKLPCLSKLATPFPAIVDTIDNIPNPQCCCCKDQLILPPLAVELPRSLGYFQSALPLVAKYFSPSVNDVMTGAYLPVANCDLVIAAPVCPEYAPLVKPIVL
ncbi:hypothetical protein SFRURICE_020930 [Spodoptera frugiperda]|nr:hypothetical protein SFRURICE_020930 [Spodoptera frugiperda]